MQRQITSTESIEKSLSTIQSESKSTASLTSRSFYKILTYLSVFELILAHLPVDDLLAIKRVSRNFKTASDKYIEKKNLQIIKTREVVVIGIEVTRPDVLEHCELKLNKEEQNELLVFDKLPAISKVNRFVQRIKNIRNILKISHPKALCIFVAREYFIQENDDGLHAMRKRSVSLEIKNLLLQKLTAITSIDPNIIIIAGSLQVQEPTTLSEVKDIFSYFSNSYYQFVKNAEMERENISLEVLKTLPLKDCVDKNLQMYVHEIEVEDVLRRHTENKEEKIDKISNQCNVVYGSHITRHDKFIPWNEVPKKSNATDTIWEIPHGPSIKANLEYKEIKFTVSICAETAQVTHLFPVSPFRFILSDSCNFDEENHRNEAYVFHLDSVHPAAFYTNENISRYPYIVSMYKTNLCSTDEKIIWVPATRLNEHISIPATPSSIHPQPRTVVTIKEKPMMASSSCLFSKRMVPPILPISDRLSL